MPGSVPEIVAVVSSCSLSTHLYHRRLLMRCGIVWLSLVLWSTPAAAFEFTTVARPAPMRRPGANGVEYANTSAKEEYGDAPWVTRNGNIPLVFIVKDANEDAMCFDYLRLYRDVGAARTLIDADE